MASMRILIAVLAVAGTLGLGACESAKHTGPASGITVEKARPDGR